MLTASPPPKQRGCVEPVECALELELQSTCFHKGPVLYPAFP